MTTEMPNMRPFEPVDAARFRAIMRAPVSSVVIVATGAKGRRAGCTVTSVCSLSDSPPSVLVCLNNASAARKAVVENGRFTVNYLLDSHQDEANRLAGRSGDTGDDKFSSDCWLDGVEGLPYLDGALATLVCDVANVLEFGTHSVVCGAISRALVADGSSPLLYGQGQYMRPQPWSPRG